MAFDLSKIKSSVFESIVDSNFEFSCAIDLETKISHILTCKNTK